MARFLFWTLVLVVILMLAWFLISQGQSPWTAIPGAIVGGFILVVLSTREERRGMSESDW